jgi:hypothetical protein
MKIATLKLALAAAAVALVTVNAQAQTATTSTPGVTGGDFGGARHKRGNAKQADTPKPKVDEKGYKAALDQLPNKQYDAWHGVR